MVLELCLEYGAIVFAIMATDWIYLHMYIYIHVSDIDRYINICDHDIPNDGGP